MCGSGSGGGVLDEAISLLQLWIFDINEKIMESIPRIRSSSMMMMTSSQEKKLALLLLCTRLSVITIVSISTVQEHVVLE